MVKFGVDLVADGWFEIGGRQEGHMRLSLELDEFEIELEKILILSTV